jgi:endonuclease-3
LSEPAAIPVIGRADRRERLRRAPSIAPKTLARLAKQHPNAKTELDYRSPFELVVSVVLSAQTTDVGVNKATPRLFAKYPDAAALAAAEPIEIEPYVATLGFFRMKAKAIVGLARALVEKHGGEVPQTMAELVKLAGVGRKTANVVLGVLWNEPEGVVVDTHVIRLSQRLGWTKNRDPEKIERDLCAILPRPEWDHAAHVLIFHGRRVCFARKPACPECRVNDVCPAAFEAEHVGRKSLPGDLKARAAKKAGAKTSKTTRSRADSTAPPTKAGRKGDQERARTRKEGPKQGGRAPERAGARRPTASPRTPKS